MVVEAGEEDPDLNDLLDTLDFSGFVSGVTLNLDTRDPQVIDVANLTLTLFSASAFEGVIGSAFADDTRAD